jgi:hypothetical protein
MKVLETDAEIHADGSLKLLSPLPDWLKPGRRHVLLVADESVQPQRLALEQRRAAIEEISRRCAALPVLDSRSPDEMLGYDQNGLPT